MKSRVHEISLKRGFLGMLLILLFLLGSMSAVRTQAASKTSITLNKTYARVITNRSYTLKATVTPSGTAAAGLTWKSSDETIATVNRKGKVVGITDGIVYITARTADGATATCKVKVITPEKVKLDKTSMTLALGKTSQLKATILPDYAYEASLFWSSSDTKVVTVTSKGKIKAVGSGTATITVKTANQKKATCTVKVAMPTKVQLNKSSLTLTSGQTYTLKATVSPTSAKSAAITWSSSNKKVVTVTSGGKLTAVGNGTAKITVKTANNKKATCTVTVVTPTNVTLNYTSLTLTPGQTTTLKATISPSSANSASITWKSSNTKVATVSSTGKVKVVGTGTAAITAITKNNKIATCNITSKAYLISGGKLIVGSKNGTRTYTLYSQLGTGGNYYRNYGCVTTAVSIAASAFGQNYSPYTIHTGSASAVYSERYALSRMGASSALYGNAISVRLASQILTDMGIKNTPVYTYNKSAAIAQIKEHLAQGKPVIVKANNTRYNGVQVANGHHAMVLVGIDTNGYGIFIEPFNGSLNYAHGNGTYFSRTVESFVNYHMTPASGNVYVPYVTGLAAAGGYILVG